MIPVARKDNLIIQEFEDELIISDGSTNAAHCLTPIAARVWEYCDGYNTIDDIARLIEDDLDIPLDKDVDMRGLIWITVEELQRYGLIKEYLNQPISDANLSRRKMLKRLSIAGGFAAGAMFPAVRSMMMPEAAMACSPNRKSSQAEGGSDCCVRPSSCPPERWNQSECKCNPPPDPCKDCQKSFNTRGSTYALPNATLLQLGAAIEEAHENCENHECTSPCRPKVVGSCSFFEKVFPGQTNSLYVVACGCECSC